MIYVMSDIHGNMRRFRSVMEKIQLRPEDTLYVLGDVIDRHPYGIEILEEIIATPNIKMTLGNHEYMMLNVLCASNVPWPRQPFVSASGIWSFNGGDVTLDAFMKRPEERRGTILYYLLHECPLSRRIEVGKKKYELVHSVPPELYVSSIHKGYSSAAEFATWNRFIYTRDVLPDYTIVNGHTPTNAEWPEGTPSIEKSYYEKEIRIDCGSGYEDVEGPPFKEKGRLACLRLDDMAEFYSDERWPP